MILSPPPQYNCGPNVPCFDTTSPQSQLQDQSFGGINERGIEPSISENEANIAHPHNDGPCHESVTENHTMSTRPSVNSMSGLMLQDNDLPGSVNDSVFTEATANYPDEPPPAYSYVPPPN